MPNKLNEVMKKLNSQRLKDKDSKKEQKKEEKEEKEEKVVDDVDDEEEEAEEETNEPEDSEKETVDDQATEDAAILANIDRLQNDGLFRYELLASLQKLVTEIQVLNYQILKATGGEEDGEEKVT